MFSGEDSFVVKHETFHRRNVHEVSLSRGMTRGTYVGRVHRNSPRLVSSSVFINASRLHSAQNVTNITVVVRARRENSFHIKARAFA